MRISAKKMVIADIQSVNAGLGKGGHAMAMVCRGIDGVNTDSIDAQLLEIWDISVTVSWLREAMRGVSQAIDE